MSKHSPRGARISVIVLIFALCLFLGFGAYQLHLPGLHYDEAKEAGMNVMELLTGRPITAFRDATLQVGPLRLPLMVQDYIGALNVALALPFLAIGGVNVVALRWLSLLTGALTLVVTWRVAWRLGGPAAAAATALLLAVNPAFIFWSRQGIFVTNLVALIFMTSLLTGLRWWELRRPRDLWLTAFLWGLGIYAKLLFVWAIGAMLALAGVAWLLDYLRGRRRNSKLEAGSWTPGTSRDTLYAAASFRSRASTLALALIYFLIPLIPLIVFNLRTGGTLDSVFGNLGQSYYGVNNSAYLPNLLMRLDQIITLLRAQHLGYLGGPFTNVWAPWLMLILVLLAGVITGLDACKAHPTRTFQQGRRGLPPILRVLAPLLLLALMIAQSAFTVSDLFITHYALLLPLIPLAGGLAFGALMQAGRESKGEDGHRNAGQGRGWAKGALRALAVIALVGWIGSDLATDIRYHRVLTVTGGHGAHSDAIYALAKRLDSLGWAAPVALDWGLGAQLRYLTAGRVQPVEVFGYENLAAPDPGYAERINRLLDDPDNIYLAHAPEHTIFRERVNALADLAWNRGLTLREQGRFNERDGTPLIIMYRAEK